MQGLLDTEETDDELGILNDLVVEEVVVEEVEEVEEVVEEVVEEGVPQLVQLTVAVQVGRHGTSPVIGIGQHKKQSCSSSSGGSQIFLQIPEATMFNLTVAENSDSISSFGMVPIGTFLINLKQNLTTPLLSHAVGRIHKVKRSSEASPVKLLFPQTCLRLSTTCVISLSVCILVIVKHHLCPNGHPKQEAGPHGLLSSHVRAAALHPTNLDLYISITPKAVPV